MHRASESCRGRACDVCQAAFANLKANPATHKLYEGAAASGALAYAGKAEFVCCYHYGLIVSRECPIVIVGREPIAIAKESFHGSA